MEYLWFIVAAVAIAVILFVGGIVFGNWNPVQNWIKKHFSLGN